MKFGIIGGSGLYDIDGMTDIESFVVDTPFGAPSDQLVKGKLDGHEVVFLPRHGRGHRLLPSEINYRANIWAMKTLEVTHLLSVSAVGSLKEEIEPGHIVLPDQFIDRTKDRPSTFFGDGLVAHVQFGDPICGDLSQAVGDSAKKTGVNYHQGGTYVCMEGPIFSTRAESEMYRQLNATVIGMTNLQEAKLAREAEICFATIALSTDYDCWHQSEEEVSVEAVLKVMAKNVKNSKAILKDVIQSYDHEKSNCACRSSLKFAILTDKGSIPEKTREKLGLLVGKYL